MSAWYPPTIHFSGSITLLRYWIPLLPPCSLNSSVSLKSLTLPSFQIRNVLFLSGTSLVLPTIAPSSTLQTRVSPSQPVRSLPLNNSFASLAVAAQAKRTDSTKAQPNTRYMARTSKLNGPETLQLPANIRTSTHKSKRTDAEMQVS